MLSAEDIQKLIEVQKEIFTTKDDFEELRNLGFSFYSDKFGHDMGGGNNLLSSPFKTVRTETPEGYQRNSQGNFSWQDETITVWTDRVERSSWELALKDAMREDMTVEDRVIFHETLHGWQNLAIEDETDRENKYRENNGIRALEEAHCFVSQDYFRPSAQDARGTEVLADSLSGGYNLELEEATEALQLIKELKALQLDDKEIAEIIGGQAVKGESPSETFNIVKENILSLKEEKGLPADVDLEIPWQIHVQKRKLLAQKLNLLVSESMARVKVKAEITTTERPDRRYPWDK